MLLYAVKAGGVSALTSGTLCHVVRVRWGDGKVPVQRFTK